MSRARFIPAPDQGDAEVVVLAAELFPEAVVIVLATTILDEVAAAGMFAGDPPALKLEDDLGTEYRRALQVSSTYASERSWWHSHGVSRLNPLFEPPRTGGGQLPAGQARQVGQRRPDDLTMPKIRFIPGPDQGDAEIVVLAVELHEGLIVIDIATTMIEAIRQPTARHGLPIVSVEDDLGNTYRGESLKRYGAGWSGQAPAAHFPFEVRPAVSPEGRFLRITFKAMYEADRSVVVML